MPAPVNLSVTNITATSARFNWEAGAASVTWDSATAQSNVTLSNGDLTATGNENSTNTKASSTEGKTTGKWYAEITIDAIASAGGSGSPWVGACTANFATNTSNPPNAEESSQGRFSNSVGGSGTVGGFTVGDVICVAFDAATREVWLRKNSNTWAGGGDPATGTTPHKTLTGTDAIHIFAKLDWSASVTVNFGASAFSYSVPSGFSGLG